jgi:hypothetical protein
LEFIYYYNDLSNTFPYFSILEKEGFGLKKTVKNNRGMATIFFDKIDKNLLAISDDLLKLLERKYDLKIDQYVRSNSGPYKPVTSDVSENEGIYRVIFLSTVSCILIFES